MAALTQHLMDRELPHVAVRQWVLSLPFPLRYTLAYDQRLCTAVHRVLARALRARLRLLARCAGSWLKSRTTSEQTSGPEIRRFHPVRRLSSLLQADRVPTFNERKIDDAC